VPRIEEKPCWFKSPSGEQARCLMLIVRENREIEGGRVLRLPVAILKARSSAPVADPVLHLSGGPGDSPLAASEPVRCDERRRLVNSTAELRRGATTSSLASVAPSCPSRSCAARTDDRALTLTRAGRPSEALERERKAMARCARQLTASGIDLTQYNTLNLADDVADLVRHWACARSICTVSAYGTRWALEVMPVILAWCARRCSTRSIRRISSPTTAKATSCMAPSRGCTPTATPTRAAAAPIRICAHGWRA